jgi:tetratricopeptide (TPR) repeat protein
MIMGPIREGFIAVLIVATAVTLPRPATADDADTCKKASGDVAIEACTRAIVSDKYSSEDLSALFFYRGKNNKDKREYDRAIADYGQAIKFNPNSVGAHINRANLFNRNKSYDRAIADIDYVLSIPSGLGNYAKGRAYDFRGDSYYGLGNFDLAIQDYTQSIRFDPTTDATFNSRCMARTIVGQLQLALADCNHALRLKPNDPNTLDSRGTTYLKMGQLDNAIRDYDSVLRQNARYASSLYGRGMAKLKKGDSAGSEADIAAAKAIQADIVEEFAKYGIKP